MLYRTLKMMIIRGRTEHMAEKLDIFYGAGKITQEQYTELVSMLPEAE